MYLTFAHPKYLFLLFIIPLIILIHLLTLRGGRKRALRFANFEAIARVRGIEFFSKNIVTTFLSVIIVLLLVFSISGLTLHKYADASSFSFVLAIDTSRSMEAEDMLPNRLEAAKEVAKTFVDTAPPTTKIGVVSFSGNAYIHLDITDNKERLSEVITEIEQSMIEGTDIYEVMITSTNLLRRGGEGKAIILLSDGQITIGTIDETVAYANDNEVIINTIGIGTEEGGRTTYGISKIDEDALKALAYNTGGQFFRAEDKKSLLESFKEAIKLTRKKVAMDLSSYLLLAGILFFLMEFILVNSRYRVLP